MNRFIFTCGDPNGIGPEIVIKTLNEVVDNKSEFIFICPKNVFLQNITSVVPKFKYSFYPDNIQVTSAIGRVNIIESRGGKISPGKPTKTSGMISYQSLNTALNLIGNEKTAAIITAPISKKAWKLNSIKYSGHTDFLGEEFNVKNPLMLFYSKKMIAALTTIHNPIKDVSRLITKVKLKSIIDSILISLKTDFQISEPRIAVLGLNPHAGEDGNIGEEELTKILPVVKEYSKYAYGPYVPDAFFGMKLYKEFDAVLGMYHDQVLIPFKMLDIKKGVNFTANLPLVRTSPDHGTAFDIAYRGKANHESMVEAFKLAKKVLTNRKHS